MLRAAIPPVLGQVPFIIMLLLQSQSHCIKDEHPIHVHPGLVWHQTNLPFTMESSSCPCLCPCRHLLHHCCQTCSSWSHCTCPCDHHTWCHSAQHRRAGLRQALGTLWHGRRHPHRHRLE